MPDPIDAALQTHRDRLLAVPGVIGVAQGRLDDGTPCIVLLVAETLRPEPAVLPDSLDGHPVVVQVSGELRARPSDT